MVVLGFAERALTVCSTYKGEPATCDESIGVYGSQAGVLVGGSREPKIHLNCTL